MRGGGRLGSSAWRLLVALRSVVPFRVVGVHLILKVPGTSRHHIGPRIVQVVRRRERPVQTRTRGNRRWWMGSKVSRLPRGLGGAAELSMCCVLRRVREPQRLDVLRQWRPVVRGLSVVRVVRVEARRSSAWSWVVP